MPLYSVNSNDCEKFLYTKLLIRNKNAYLKFHEERSFTKMIFTALNIEKIV